jgi:ribosome-associated protein
MLGNEMLGGAVMKLDQFLKFQGVVSTGGQAKLLIQDGFVKVNGQPELRRGRKLAVGDRVFAMGQTFTIDTLEPENEIS